MSDRSGAELFAMIFKMLAEEPTKEHKAFARKIWARRGGFDFDDYQMYCDEALIKLGLAVKIDDEIKYGP
jgi:hypothetical protein